jgi:hypothetical protein
MLIVSRRQSQEKAESLPTDEEYQRFAEEFVDAVLDPRQPWLPQYIMVFGFPAVPTEDHIASGALAAKMRSAIEGSHSFPIDEWIYEGLTKLDRQKLVDGFKEGAKQRELTKEELSRLLACGDFKTLKKSLKGMAKPFKFRPGPAPPSERQYDEALRQAEVLVPALLQLLNQQSAGTRRSLSEILHFLAKDFPEACKFLLENSQRVDDCLRDPKLLKRAKARPRARAHVLADAISGSIHLNREATTAVEYLRIERRRRLKSSR